MKARLSAASNHDARDHGDQRSVNQPSFSSQRQEVGEHGGEEGNGCADRLTEGDGEKAQRDVIAHHRGTKDDTQGRDLHKLGLRSDCLHRDYLQPCDCYVTQQCTCRHVAHGQEDGVSETVIAQQILVQQQHSDVGGVPSAINPTVNTFPDILAPPMMDAD